MAFSSNVHIEIPAALVQALRRILRPVARLLIRHQIRLPVLMEMVKGAYVEEAERSFSLEEKPPTDSRIHLLTGVHRKDVRRIRDEQEADESAPAAVSLAGRIVAYWTGDRNYANEAGEPLELPKKAGEGTPSFETLVAAVFKQDVRPRTVLDDLSSLGVIMENEHSVRLNMDAFIPDQGFDEKCYYLGRNTSDHLTAAVQNVEGGDPPFPERSVYYSGLCREAVEELRALARSEGMKALKKVNRRALELKQEEEGLAEPLRMNFGFYYYAQPQEQTDDDPETP